MYITVNNTNYYIVDIRASDDELDVMLTTDASQRISESVGI